MSGREILNPALRLVMDTDARYFGEDATDGTPEIQALSIAAVDSMAVGIINDRIGSSVDRYIDRDTAWAAKRCEGLPFTNEEARFAFLYMRARDELPNGKPMTPVMATRLMRIALSLQVAADAASDMLRERQDGAA